MPNLEIWKLATDICLVLSLVYLCYRFVRQPGSAAISGKAAELESMLRELVQEADAASKSLNDKLLRRQQVLEKLLFDLGTVEHRVNRAIENAEEEKSILGTTIESAKLIADEMRKGAHTPSPAMQAPHQARAEQPTPQAPSASDIERSFKPTPLSSQIEKASIVESTPAPRAAAAVNIYGEPIGETAPAAPQQKEQSTLSSRVERNVEPAPKERPAPAKPKTLEDIYKAADEMLRAGKDLKYVAAALQLPIEQARMLMELMKEEESTEEQNKKITTEDPRLGVFARTDIPAEKPQSAPIRRQVQVL